MNYIFYCITLVIILLFNLLFIYSNIYEYLLNYIIHFIILLFIIEFIMLHYYSFCLFHNLLFLFIYLVFFIFLPLVLFFYSYLFLHECHMEPVTPSKWSCEVFMSLPETDVYVRCPKQNPTIFAVGWWRTIKKHTPWRTSSIPFWTMTYV